LQIKKEIKKLTFVVKCRRIPSLGEYQDEVRAQPATPYSGQERRQNFVAGMLDEYEDGANTQVAVPHVEIT
jgi:hypothetical protein